MVYEDLIGHFGAPSDAAKALGVDRRLVDGWKKRRIPTKHQLKAQSLSSGELTPDVEAQRDAEELRAIFQVGAE